MPALLEAHFVLDLRSSNYAPMWRPIDTDRVASLQVMQLRNGRRTAVSHMNKATKGRIVRLLGEQRREPQDVAAVANVIAAGGYDVTVAAGGNVIEVLAPTLAP